VSVTSSAEWMPPELDPVAGTEPAPPQGGVNWEAYSHEELYRMLWQDADVMDVSNLATDWEQHRSALRTHAEVLREQGAALLESWRGPAAEEAAGRLETLADRMDKISELAGAGHQATQNAADALAMARAMMPPPPSDPMAPLGAAGMPPPAAPASDPLAFLNTAGMGAPAAFAPPAAPAPVASPEPTGTAFGAVGSAGFSFYVGAAGTEAQKAQAVQAMRDYESTLDGSSQLLGNARGAVPAAATLPDAATTPAGQTTPSLAVADRLGGTGTGAGRGFGAGAITGAPAGSGADPLGPGARLGVGSGPVPAAQLAAETAAARAGQPGMVPPVGGQRGAGTDDEKHENQLPTIDQGLFAVTDPASQPVIYSTWGVRA